MVIAVLGSDGRSGRAFVRAALNNGHIIRAGYRNNAPSIEHENYIPIKCNGENPDEVALLIQDADAVLCLIGHVKGSHARTQTESIRNIIASMRKNNIKRLISLTGTGVRFPGDRPNSIDKVLNFSIKLIDPQRILDGIDHVEEIKYSDLDWTIVRVLKLQNTRPTSFRLTEGGPAKLITSRVEVAKACLEVLEKNEFMQKAPIISKG